MNSFILDEKTKFFLNDFEINSILKISTHLNGNQTFYAIHELYAVFYANILRRIEYYDVDFFIKELPQNILIENNYNNIIKKWDNYNKLEILNLAKQTKVIDNTTFYLFLALDEYIKNILASDTIDNEYVTSYFKIIKYNLFDKELLKNTTLTYKRRKSDLKRRDSDLKRRDSDFDKSEDDTIINTNHLNPKTVISKFNKNLLDDKNTTNKLVYV